ncbi:MAG: FtsX-like permease family protein [Streptomyces sp.]
MCPVRGAVAADGSLMYGLLAIGVVISALGIVNTLAMSVAERIRDIGVLRAIGMYRSAIRRMIRLEAVTVAAFGALLGPAGGVFGAWAVGALADGAMEQHTLSTPWGTLALVCLASLAMGALAVALPARPAEPAGGRRGGLRRAGRRPLPSRQEGEGGGLLSPPA